jgi:hypothetical protein
MPKGSAKPLLPGATHKRAILPGMTHKRAILPGMTHKRAILPGMTHKYADEPLISLTKHDFVKEHKNLIKLLEIGDKLEHEAKDQQAELNMVTGSGKRKTWIQALNEWNKGNDKWYIPKKGSKEYDAIKALM